MKEEIAVKCEGCGKEGGDNVLTLDETTVWECKCGTKNRYISSGDQAKLREVHIADQAEAAQKEG